MVRPSDGTVKMLEAGDLPLEVFSAARRVSRMIELEPGTVVALYIDGLTEATQIEGYRQYCRAEALRAAAILVGLPDARRHSHHSCLFGPGPTPGP